MSKLKKLKHTKLLKFASYCGSTMSSLIIIGDICHVILSAMVAMVYLWSPHWCIMRGNQAESMEGILEYCSWKPVCGDEF